MAVPPSKKRSVDVMLAPPASASSDAVVTLIVGGRSFMTRTSTLVNGSRYFAAMFSGDFAETQSAAAPIFIDRNPDTFDRILDELRRGAPGDAVPEKREDQIKLCTEAEFFGLDALADALRLALSGKRAISVVEFTLTKPAVGPKNGDGPMWVSRDSTDAHWFACTERGTELSDVIGLPLAQRFVTAEMYDMLFEVSDVSTAFNHDGTSLGVSTSCLYDDPATTCDEVRSKPGGWLTAPTLIAASAANGYKVAAVSHSNRQVLQPQSFFGKDKPAPQMATADITLIRVEKELVGISPERKLELLSLPGTAVPDEALWTEADQKRLENKIKMTRDKRNGERPDPKDYGYAKPFYALSYPRVGSDNDDSKYEAKLQKEADKYKMKELSKPAAQRLFYKLSGDHNEWYEKRFG
jgi:hypothetical protein